MYSSRVQTGLRIESKAELKKAQNSLLAILVAVCASEKEKEKRQSQCPVLSSVVRQCGNASESSSDSPKTRKTKNARRTPSQSIVVFDVVIEGGLVGWVLPKQIRSSLIDIVPHSQDLNQKKLR